LQRGRHIAQVRPHAESETELRAWLLAEQGAVSRAVRLAGQFAASHDLDPDATSRLAVVVEEWIANVLEHGGGGRAARIILKLRLTDGVIRLSVSDAGQAFDPRAVSFDGPNHERGGGAGVALIASLCRIADYSRRSGRNRLVLELPLQGA
jgi:serine/threonine-protein kinase RsbW